MTQLTRSPSNPVRLKEYKWCQPALPPDSQREVTVALQDPLNDPTAKVLYFRVEMAQCNNPDPTPCSKYIPTLDPLGPGGYARLKLADMILVDDDNLIQPSGPLWDIKDRFIDGTQTYPVTLGSTEPGSGIVSSSFSHTSTYPPATDSLGSQNAPCDPAHNTPPLDNRICPATFSWDTSVPTPPYPEGPNTFTETATDNAGNVGPRLDDLHRPHPLRLGRRFRCLLRSGRRLHQRPTVVRAQHLRARPRS